MRNLIRMFYDVFDSRDGDGSKDDLSTASFSIGSFLNWVKEVHPLFFAELIQVGIADTGFAVMGTSDKGVAYFKKHEADFRAALKLKLGCSKVMCVSETESHGDDVSDIELLEGAPPDLYAYLKEVLDKDDIPVDPNVDGEMEGMSLAEFFSCVDPDLLEVPLPLEVIADLLEDIYTVRLNDLANEEYETILESVIALRQHKADDR